MSGEGLRDGTISDSRLKAGVIRNAGESLANSIRAVWYKSCIVKLLFRKFGACAIYFAEME